MKFKLNKDYDASMTLFPDASSLDALAAEVRVCTRCELAQTRMRAVPGQGDPGSRALFVGHAPGSTDDATGEPYTGPGGALLDALFAQAGIGRERVFITNLVKCWPWKEEFGNRINRTPSQKEIKACAPVFLRQELEIMRPSAIVCLGGPTAQQFLGKEFRITQSRGEWLALPDSSPILKLIGALEVRPAVMAILQPAYLIHLEQHSPEAFPGARQAMLRDLGKVKRVLDGEEPEIKGASAASDEETPF